MKNKFLSFIFILIVSVSSANGASITDGFSEVFNKTKEYSQKLVEIIAGKRTDIEKKIDEKKQQLKISIKLLKELNFNLRQAGSLVIYTREANERCNTNYKKQIQTLIDVSIREKWLPETVQSNKSRYRTELMSCTKEAGDLNSRIKDVNDKLTKAREFLRKEGLNESLLQNELNILENELSELTRLVEHN